MQYCDRTTLRKLCIAALASVATHAGAIELRGAIRSNGVAAPACATITAQRMDGQPAIVGTVKDGRYRIDVPESGMLALLLQAPGWEAEPKIIYAASTAGALDFLLYPAQLPEPALARELLAMEQEDQALRTGWPPGGPDTATRKRMLETDAAHEARLKQIISAKGWPGQSMVGYRAANSAWLIAQHGSKVFLKSSLGLMQKAAAQLEITPSKLALSIDRDLSNDGQQQLYGSQFRIGSDGKNVAFPIADPERLDARRASMGLQPFADYQRLLE